MKSSPVKSWFGDIAGIDEQRSQSNKLYREFLRVPAMSAGLYVLAPGAVDPQRPHHEDEMYYVVRGRARFRAADEDNAKSLPRQRSVCRGKRRAPLLRHC